jgi:hypothetical protein
VFSLGVNVFGDGAEGCCRRFGGTYWLHLQGRLLCLADEGIVYVSYLFIPLGR